MATAAQRYNSRMTKILREAREAQDREKRTKNAKAFGQAFESTLELLVSCREDLDQAKAHAKAIGQYNGFDPEKVAEMLDRIDRAIPRKYYNEGNPNNGSRVWQVAIGRESSPVIYVYSYFARDLEKVDPDAIKAAAQAAEADEIDSWDAPIFGVTPALCYRLWWD